MWVRKGSQLRQAMTETGTFGKLTCFTYEA